MKKECQYCGLHVERPCLTAQALANYVFGPLRPLQRCVDAYKRQQSVGAAKHPAEDAFAVPQNGHHSDTAKAQMALGSLPGAFGAPTPFEWGLMVEDAARGNVRSLELRPEDVQRVPLGEIHLKALEAVGQAVKAAPAVSKTEGVKFDDGKLRFDLIPPDALAVVAAVLTYGALKYDDRNWELGMDRARLRAARARHESRRQLGERIDPETGLPHLAHEAACTLMELSLWLREKGSDTGAAIPEGTRNLVDGFAKAAVEAGRIAAARKGAHHG